MGLLNLLWLVIFVHPAGSSVSQVNMLQTLVDPHMHYVACDRVQRRLELSSSNNILPQQLGLTFSYEGSLPAGSSFSFVSDSLTCAAEGPATPSQHHSGPLITTRNQTRFVVNAI